MFRPPDGLPVRPNFDKFNPINPGALSPPFGVRIVRPADMLVLSFHFLNFELLNEEMGQERILVLVSGKNDTEPSLIVVGFPPQSVAEQTFLEENAPAPKQPVWGQLANTSVLTFKVSMENQRVPFTLAGILDLIRNSPIVEMPPSFGQQDPKGITIHDRYFAAGSPKSLLEVPAGLLLTLTSQSDILWNHAPEPVVGQQTKRIELWHTRLTNANGEETGRARVIGINSLGRPENTLFPLTINDLQKLLISSRLNHLINIDRLMLTALGAWFNTDSELKDDQAQSYQWTHRMTGGRDQYVRVITEGFLYPFGHRASLIKLTERKFQGFDGGKAFLRTRFFVVVRQPTITYDAQYMNKSAGFEWKPLPFRTITIRTRTTPNLDNPESAPQNLLEKDSAASGVVSGVQQAFRMRVGGQDFRFQIIAQDWEKRFVEFEAPMIFISDTEPDNMDALNERYALTTADAVGIPAFGGQKVAYAPPAAANQDGTSFITNTMSFQGSVQKVGGGAVFAPEMKTAAIVIPALQTLTGSTQAASVKYTQKFLDGEPNLADVFLQVVDSNNPNSSATVPAKFPIDKVGGLIAPNMAVDGLSRSLGAVPDVAGLLNDSFSVAAVFGGVDGPKLLGAFTLNAILKPGNFQQPADIIIPSATTRKVTLPNPGEVTETSYTYQVPKPGFRTEFDIPGVDIAFQNTALLSLKTTIQQPLSGGSPKFVNDGKLEAFSITLGDLVQADFNSIHFHSENGSKPDVSIDFGGIKFLGFLEFVNDLSKLIPLDGFSDPPFLDVIPPGEPNAGITTGYSLGIPTLAMGMFNFANIALSSSMHLPFTDKAMHMRFAFCEREQPCTITVNGLGGGAFVAVVVSLKGVELVEGSIEFGAAVALNLGVAAGMASVMGGVYVQKAGSDWKMTAYIRATGELEIIGLISVSVTLYVAMEYESASARFSGVALVKIKVSVAFFSKTVGVEMKRSLAGSDPSFSDTYPTLMLWEAYDSGFDHNAYPIE